MTSPEEQATLSKLRAGTHVVVPVEVLRFLNGERPDASGVDFLIDQKRILTAGFRKERFLGAFGGVAT